MEKTRTQFHHMLTNYLKLYNKYDRLKESIFFNNIVNQLDK